MLLSELPEDIQKGLIESRKELKDKWSINTSYEVCVVDKDCTRYLYAYRSNDWDGYRCNASAWYISYGAIQWRKQVEHFGWGFPDKVEYIWVKGKRFGSRTKEDGSKVDIPKSVHRKKEVLQLIKELGIF